MSNGDPLRLRERSARRLREVWYLMDPDRLFARAVAACAESAAHDEPPPDLDAWALEMIDRAVDQLVHADREAEHTKHSTPTDEEVDFPLLTESLMLEPEDVRRVSVAFNALDALPRRAFFELMIEGREPPEIVEAGPWDEDGLRTAVLTALSAFDLDPREDSPEDRKQRRSRK